MRRVWVALAVVAAGAGLAGCAAQGAAQGAADSATQTPEYRSIPTTTNRAPDPSATPRADGSITADEAPLSQLWAMVDSSLAHGGYADSARAAGSLPRDVSDFADAVTTRCVPGLTADESSRLSTLWGGVQTAAASAGGDLTPQISAYVTEASTLCM